MSEDFHSESEIASDGPAMLMVGGIAYTIPRELAVLTLELARLVAQAEAGG